MQSLNIPHDVQIAAQKLLELKFSQTVLLKSFSPIEGGCINHGGLLKTSAGDFFLKWNEAGKFQNMFKTEAMGLQLLRSVKSIHVPEVIGYDQGQSNQLIILEFIEGTINSKNYWRHLGSGLANLHMNHNDSFGLDYHNYIGSLQQFNNKKTTWAAFFVEERLAVQVKLAVDAKRADVSLLHKLENIYGEIPSIFPEEKPSLLHGDLWSGNVIVNSKGEPSLIDPAVYYGHREAELAFTNLFGGFDKEFLMAYETYFPLLPGFDQRIAVYNLYPLLVHLNLFGASYLPSIMSVLNRLS